MLKHCLQTGLAAVVLFCSGVFAAAEVDGAHQLQQPTAHQVIDSVTTELLGKIRTKNQEYRTKPENFYREVQQLMDSVVDYQGLAKGVMGKRFYTKASPEQRQRFLNVFKLSLIETYAKGMLNYSDEKVVLLPPKASDKGKKRVSVGQEIHSATDVFPVSYTMVMNKQGEWKLLNVVINGVNLGKTFRGQFAQAMKKNAGDIDKVIDTWKGDTPEDA